MMGHEGDTLFGFFPLRYIVDNNHEIPGYALAIANDNAICGKYERLAPRISIS